MNQARKHLSRPKATGFGLEPQGATPIEAEDLEGLIPQFVVTRAELNQVEYENIAKALPWAERQATLLGPVKLLDDQFLSALHRRMFDDVWRWAGTPRLRDTNIGVAPEQIAVQVRQVFDDVRYWHEHDVFSVDGRAVRLHFRLVSVHPFTNGNGRCTRLMADLYLNALGAPRFTWGSGDLDHATAVRSEYIAALERAREDDCASLLAFSRS